MKRKAFSRDYWRLCTGSLLFFLSFNIVLPELPDQLRRAGGAEHLGWLVSIFALGALASRPFGGWVTDRYGRRYAMLGGTILCAVTGIFYPVALTVLLLLSARAIHGFFSGFAPTAFTAYTTDIVPEERRGEALGWQGMFGNIGASLGFALGSVAAHAFSTNAVFLIGAGMSFLSFVVLWPLPETRKEGVKPRFGLKEIFYLKVWKPAILMMLICIPLGGILILMPDYTRHLGFAHKGIFLTIYVLASVVVRIFSGKLSDRLGRPFSAAIGTMLQALSMAMLALGTGTVWFVTAAIFYGVGQGFNAPTLFAWAGDDSTESTRGRALSMLFVSLESGVVVGGLLAGRVFGGRMEQMQVLFWIWCGVSLAGLAFSLLFIRQHRRKGIDLQGDSLEI